MATKVGDVFAELRIRADKAEADIKSFKSELKKTTGELDKGERKTKTLGKSFKELGRGARVAGGQIAKGIGIGTAAITVAGAAAFTFAKRWAATVDEVGKAAGKFKITAQELQALEHAADLSGASAQSLRKSIQNLNKFITEGEQKGVTPFTEALFQLGLSIDDIKGKTKTEVFGIISDELNKLTDVEQKATLQMRLFGEEAGPQLANFTDQGSKGINAMVAEVEKLGGTLDKDALQAAANLNDELARGRVVMSGVANFINTRLAPVVTRISARFRKWVMANRDLIATKLERFLVASASAAERLLPKIVDLAEGVFKFVESMGGIEGALKTAGLAIVAFELVFVAAFGPFGPIVAGLVAVIALIDQIGSRTRKAKEEIDKAASTRALSDPELSGQLPSASVLSKTQSGRTIVDLLRQKEVFEKEEEAALANLERLKKEQEQIQVTASRSRTGAGFATATARIAKDRSRFDEQIRDSQVQIKSLNKIIKSQFAEFQREQSDNAAQRSEAGAAKDAARERKMAEFKRLARLATNKDASPAQLRRLSALEKDLKIKRPEASPSFFAPSQAGETEAPKTPQQLIQDALGGGGRLNVGGLVPSGPGTTINHNNFSINLAAPDIDIIIKGLPANANAMDVANRVKDEMRTAIQDTVRISYQTQIQQVIG